MERHNLPKLTQEETDDLNRPTSIKEIESIINTFPKHEAVGPNGFTGKFYQRFKKEIIPILYNLFQRIEAEGLLPNSFFESSITLILKNRQRHYKKTTYQYLSCSYVNTDANILNKILAN